MALRITEEERSILKDEFLAENDSIIELYARTILEYCDSKELLSEIEIIDDIFPDNATIRHVAGNILFILATTEKGAKPLQSIAGSVSGMMSKTDSFQDRKNAMHTAMELLIVSKPFVEYSTSRNGHPMIESMISDEQLIIKNIILPLERPSEDHQTLGAFNWKLSNIDALDKLNKVPMKIIDIQEPVPAQPSGNQYTKEYIAQQEKCNKYTIRQFLKEEYKDKTIYFNWSADYRNRMYSVGFHLNPQGDEYEKSMLAFAKGKKLDFYGIQQYKCSVASAYSKKLAKSTKEEQLAWFEKNRKVLHLRKQNAHEPHVFDALLLGWNQHLSGSEVTVPVEIDATTSFAQIMAVLLKSQTIAEKCNVVNITENDKTKPQDLYNIVAKRMSEIISA